MHSLFFDKDNVNTSDSRQFLNSFLMRLTETLLFFLSFWALGQVKTDPCKVVFSIL